MLKLRYPAPDAWRRAKCDGTNTEFFFEEEFSVSATQYCNGDVDGIVCPVREECLKYALANGCNDGVWGGMDEISRKAVRIRWPMSRGQQAKLPAEWHWMPREEALAGLDPAWLAKVPEQDERDPVRLSLTAGSRK